MPIDDPEAVVMVPASRRPPALSIQQLAGHSSLKMTMRYMHLTPAALDAAIQLLDGRGNSLATAGSAGRKSNG
jgi:hypothetical protein